MTAPKLDQEQVLYRFWAADGELLYVGITNDPGRRWGEHSGDKPWWHEVATITVERFANRAAVELAERLAIIKERPLRNITHDAAGAAYWARIAAASWAAGFDDFIAPRSVRAEWRRRFVRVNSATIATLVALEVVIMAAFLLTIMGPPGPRVADALWPLSLLLIALFWGLRPGVRRLAPFRAEAR